MNGEQQGPDRIDHEILINAPIEQGWRLVSEPGWWIGDGDRVDQVVNREGDLVVVEDPRFGPWPLRPLSSQPPHHVSFQAPAVPGQAPEPGACTLVEFFLSEHGAAATRLRVVESGFASLDVPVERRAVTVEGNSAGWQQQLGFAKRNAERIRR
jgi:uncharacterized protein YndB with AHSA1/START domain